MRLIILHQWRSADGYDPIGANLIVLRVKNVANVPKLLKSEYGHNTRIIVNAETKDGPEGVLYDPDIATSKQ